MKNRYLVLELGNCYIFIDCSIFPTSHTYTLSKDRLILLDSILNIENVDIGRIGRIINREIIDCSSKTEVFNFFPCLITELCMKQGVEISADEHQHRKFPQGPLSAGMKERTKIKVEPNNLVQEQLMQKHQAVWKFQQEQHDWLQMSQVPTQLETPEIPAWVFQEPEEEKEEEEGEQE